MNGTTYEEYKANKYTAAYIYFGNDENFTSKFPGKNPKRDPVKSENMKHKDLYPILHSEIIQDLTKLCEFLLTNYHIHEVMHMY